MMKQKEKAVTGLTAGVAHLLKANKADYVQGWGNITGPNTVSVDLLDGSKSTLQSKKILIATGSEPSGLPGIDIDEKTIVTFTGKLALMKAHWS
jgi:dihydrolipoamide dehydrogenase